VYLREFDEPALRAEGYFDLDWVVIGGESGPNHRIMELAWVDQIFIDCFDADIPILFKQWGGRTPKSGGRLLNGREYNEFPRMREEGEI
jgi:protein gp37